MWSTSCCRAIPPSPSPGGSASRRAGRRQEVWRGAMSRTAIGTKVRLGVMAGRNAGRAALARLYTSRLYRWRFGAGRPERLLLAPQDLRAADPTRAEEIIQNR